MFKFLFVFRQDVNEYFFFIQQDASKTATSSSHHDSEYDTASDEVIPRKLNESYASVATSFAIMFITKDNKNTLESRVPYLLVHYGCLQVID